MKPRPTIALGALDQAHSPGDSRGAEARSIFEGVNEAPTCIGDALNSIEFVAARLKARGDARAVFPEVYAVITRRVKSMVDGAPGPSFLEPRWISRLAGRFCEHYLRALSASFASAPQQGAAWAIAFGLCDEGGAPASVDAILGINAHINFDLALCLYENIVDHGAARDLRLIERYRHDHDQVNDVLAASMPEILAILSATYHCPLATLATRSRRLAAAASRAVVLTLQRWRDRVWSNLIVMLAATDPSALAAVVAQMDRRSTRIARAVRMGLALGRIVAPADAAPRPTSSAPRRGRSKAPPEPRPHGVAAAAPPPPSAAP